MEISLTCCLCGGTGLDVVLSDRIGLERTGESSTGGQMHSLLTLLWKLSFSSHSRRRIEESYSYRKTTTDSHKFKMMLSKMRTFSSSSFISSTLFLEFLCKSWYNSNRINTILSSRRFNFIVCGIAGKIRELEKITRRNVTFAHKELYLSPEFCIFLHPPPLIATYVTPSFTVRF